ncbi:PEP-CTERM system histidine kinase PrsK [Rhizorhabdus dicambivorans]|uniref:histidine kinase n=2 Tax=Rhizorhabdus dicambivorans TaxID=1850238 RepID=A0A2A4FZY9_9SPHN|nr:PEP-CTERM system histidine kinase PrsK [Rhizorhabdus dicambivorans]PCE44032.1 PEP-CTERM system histidine kinase PrsK [Rhizorhabdus dicambivorans]
MLAQQAEMPTVYATSLPEPVIFAGIQWGHALAAFMFAALVGWQMTVRTGGPRRVALTLACGLTALWCLLVARYGAGGISSSVAKSLADAAWLGFLFALQPPTAAGRRRPVILAIYVLLGTLIVAAIVIKLLPFAFTGSPRIQQGLFVSGQALRILVTIGGLCLLHNLYTAASPEARFGLGSPMLALAVMWGFDLNIATVAYLIDGWPMGLFALRGMLMVLIAPMLVTVSRLATLDRVRASRSAGFQTLTLVLSGAYLAAMVLTDRLLALGGYERWLPQLTLAAAFFAFALSLFPSTRYRQRFKKALGRHLFHHRYDYRLEWRRFTETVGQPGEAAPPLAERTVKAIADIFDCPGGLLLLRGPDGGLEASARWNWQELDAPVAAAGPDLATLLEAQGDVIEIARIRQGEEPAALPLVPEWMIAEEVAWAIVPLIHFDRLVGAVLLERPREPRLLDDEDHDLLRVAGRQVASYLAEARGQEALSDARRFDEFNRRFAFIMHDIKNLVSQLSLLARNAERHADKPEFRADMIDTLQNSVGKMNDLLARLSQHHRARPDEPAPHSLRLLVEETLRDRARAYPVRIVSKDDVMATVDPDRFEQALGHLVQNAIDASGGEPVEIVIARRGLEAVVEVADKGCGMSAEFIRSRLFHPFSSTKEGGFGIGAYEARAIVVGMGGRLNVQSREGEGSRFTITLPMAALLSGTIAGASA